MLWLDGMPTTRNKGKNNRFKEVKENDFNLNIPRYVDTFEEEEEIDIMALQSEIESLEAELVQVRSKMTAILQEIKQ